MQNKSELQKELQTLQSQVTALKEAKSKDAKAFTKEQQAKLDELVSKVVDLEEQIETAEEATETKKYEAPAGTEKMVHLMIIKGNRFDAKTGKEIAHPRFQIFNYGEWQLFKQNFTRLGYTITEVLHDPYNEAAEFVTK